MLQSSDYSARSATNCSERTPMSTAFNVGINCGAAAGQTVFHCHVHLIPRRHGIPPTLVAVCDMSLLARVITRG